MRNVNVNEPQNQQSCQTSVSGWISVTDVDRLPKNSDDWYIVARGKIVLVKGHCYLYGSWRSCGKLVQNLN